MTALPLPPLKTPGPQNKAEPSTKRLLVIEDDYAIGVLLRHILEREGYTVEVSTSIPAAKETLARALSELDLILLDINLPGGTGFEILQIIRETSQIPVLFLSALKQGNNVERALSLGAQDFIVKPFNPKELILRIKRFI
jgi:DNA-binding response OmpR family regulator